MYKKIRMTTTHVDRHNERISVDALNNFVESINQQYTPVGVEHDPRIPPIGRVISAQIEKLPDGEFAVDGIVEIFDAEQEIEFKNDGREIPVEITGEAITISPDRSYLEPGDKESLLEVKELINGEIKPAVKKSVEPISILIIAATFIAGGIAQGFLSKIGEDIWDKFKVKLNGLVNSKTRIKKDRLLVFEFTVGAEDNPLCLETILTNPSESEINKFMNEGLKQLDIQTNRFFKHRHYLRKVIFEYKDNKLRVIYSLRKDGVPLSIPDEKSTNDEA
jgi:hypothetical protein